MRHALGSLASGYFGPREPLMGYPLLFPIAILLLVFILPTFLSPCMTASVTFFEGFDESGRYVSNVNFTWHILQRWRSAD